MTVRYYLATQTAYEQARAAIDSAMGLPVPGTITSIEPAATAPKATDGRVAVAVCEDIVDEANVPAVFAGMASAGTAAEITAQQYFAAIGQAFREAAGI